MNIPKEFNERFIVGEELVKRPSCTVYRGKDRQLGERDVAIKVFVDRPGEDEQAINDFKEQIGKLRVASHPALVPIVHGDCEDGWFYIVMELIEEGTLRDRLKEQQGSFSIEAALGIIGELANGVKEIHESGAVHGHIDSRAVLFKGEEVRLAGYYPAVIDQIQKGESTSGRLSVEPAYVAPEQISGTSIDHRADIFALTVLLFEMVTGKRPFEADNPLQTAMLRLSKDPPSPAKLNPQVSPLLDAAIMKGLARDTNERFSNIAAFIQAVTGGRGGPKNPLAEMGQGAEAVPIGEQTIGVSMSTDAIKEMLRSQEGGQGASQKSQTSAESGRQGVAETMVGTPAYGAGATTATGAMDAGSAQATQSRMFGGSFIVLNGELRGQKYWLGKGQTMIGGDSGCDICLSGKDIPMRYAIVVERDDNYYIGPLSPGGVQLNDEVMEKSEDVPLKRGDVLTVGPHRLRFVEPKEVFTLQDDVADRVIDRPESKLPKILGLTAAGVAAVGLVAFVLYESTVTEKKDLAGQRAAKEAHERKELVAKLRKEGDELFREGALIEPIGANAKKRFEQILELEPDDSYAKQRLIEIGERVRILEAQRERRQQLAQKIDKYLLDGDRYFQGRRYVSPPGANAKETYLEVLRIDPGNERAKQRLAEIDGILKDVVGRVNSLIAQAREYRDQGQFVSPPGENAYDLLAEVRRMDPDNAEARSLIYEMAARSIVEGDLAKAEARLQDMRRSYLMAQALGVDPAYIKPRMKGTDLIRKSRSSMIFVDRQAKKKKKEDSKKSSESKYLDSKELERRVAEYQLQRSITEDPDKRKFIDMRSLE